jgi:hypothetical protein
MLAAAGRNDGGGGGFSGTLEGHVQQYIDVQQQVHDAISEGAFPVGAPAGR